MRSLAALTIACLLAACGAPDAGERAEDGSHVPPPKPENAETVAFERPPAEARPDASADDDAGASGGDKPTRYWGIEPGEPLPLLWEDLMPEGSYEELLRQQDAFLADLQQRYQANATTLAEADTFEQIEEGSELDFMPQLGNFDVVEELDGELVRIPGYVVPFDFDPAQRHAEFLFVPYMGACIHTPPPPPNQVIFVRAEPSVRVKDIWAPYWLKGVLSAEQNENDLGDAAYALNLEGLEPYPVVGAGP